jgi:hypothetical protein
MPPKPRPAKKAVSKPVEQARARSPAASEAKLDPRLLSIHRLFSKEPRVSVGRLFSALGLKVDGKIFAMVVRGALVVKLPKSRVDELVAANAGRRFEPGPGRIMKEWISMTASKPDAASLGREAFAFVSARR